MSKKNQGQPKYEQTEEFYGGEFVPEEDASAEDDWVHLMDFRPDPRATCLRLEQGIPELLAMIVPANMEITKVGNCGEDELYIVRQIVACGTGNEIIQQIAQLQNADNI